jgi:hypothetical protein
MTLTLRRLLFSWLVVIGLAIPSQAATRCAPSAAPAGGCTTTHVDLQATIDAANAGDLVSLCHTCTYTGAFILRNKGVLTQYITLDTDADPANLPAPNVRICGGSKCGTDLTSTYGPDLRTVPDSSPYLPKIASVGGGAAMFTSEDGANHYVLRHLDILPIPYGYNTQIVLGGADSGQQFATQQPSFIIIDQCYLHGDPFVGQIRSIAINGKSISITNNFIENSGLGVGQDGQCIAGWNGQGPVTIINNLLECGAENFLLGGSDPWIRTRMAITGSPTTTSATVTTTEASHTLAELAIGQTLAICPTSTSATACVGSTVQFATVVSRDTGASGSVTWTPAITVTPNTTGLIRAGAVLDGLTFRRNYVMKNPAWMNAIMGTPSMTNAVASSGGTLSGTRYYKAQIWNDNGNQQQTVRGPIASTEVSATASSQKITVTYSTVPNTGYVRMFRGTSPGGENEHTDCSTTACLTGTFVDDGSLTWAAGSPGGYDTWVLKNNFQLKACKHCQVDSNIFSVSPKASDTGGMTWLKNVNQEGGAWFIDSGWYTVELNLWQHGAGCLIVNGRESENGPRPPALHDVIYRNNLCSDSTLTWAPGAEQPYAIATNDTIVNLTLQHNTFIHTMNGLWQVDGLVSSGLVIKDNMWRGVTYGLKSSQGDGQGMLDYYFPGWVALSNAFGNISSSGYPTGNTYETLSAWQAEFTNYSDNGTLADYVLAPGSALRNAGSDGKDVGVDIAALSAAIADVPTGGAGGGGGGGSLPPPWVNQDIGSPGLAGSASYSTGVFTIAGSGADIFDPPDAFQYVYQSIGTAATITARVVTEQNTDDFAKVGIMIRQTTAAGSPHVILSRKPDGSLEFMQRTTLNGNTTFLAGGTQALPAWLRLVVLGTAVIGAASPDGTTWTTIGTATLTLPAGSMGLVVNSHNDSLLNTSTFDNVAVVGGITRLRVRRRDNEEAGLDPVHLQIGDNHLQRAGVVLGAITLRRCEADPHAYAELIPAHW